MRFMVGVPSAEIVAAILRVFFRDTSTALDLTPGTRTFWSETVPTQVSVVFSASDFTALPYGDAAFDVAIFDPPHLADAGQKSIMAARYGTYKNVDLEPAVPAGCREAWRVARVGAIAKVTDHVHESRFVRQSRWIFDELGEPYDEVYAVRQPLSDKKWREPQLCARSNGSKYLIFHKGEQRHQRRAA
jgi:hypothetical protein